MGVLSGQTFLCRVHFGLKLNNCVLLAFLKCFPVFKRQLGLKFCQVSLQIILCTVFEEPRFEENVVDFGKF